MHPKCAVMIRVLMNKYYKGSPQALLSPLPSEEAKEILENNCPADKPQIVLISSQEKIAPIHYSWFVELIEKLPKDAQPVMVASFPEKQAVKLTRKFNLNEPLPTLPDIVKAFLINRFYSHFVGNEEPLPKEYLPQTPLSPLGTLNKDGLVEIVEFLGLHDLADELRQVVVKKTIQMVYACLNPNEQHYLRFCMQQKEKVAAPPLGLDRWSGDCEKLKVTLQLRGIMRLGKALSAENPDLIWHLVHTLDIGRGQALMKYYSSPLAAGITQALMQQVTNLFNILKRKSDM